jgi:hypothetical protein
VKWHAKVHLVCLVFWLVVIPPSLIWWRDSVPWLIFMSLWANVAAHGGGYVAAKAEENAGS